MKESSKGLVEFHISPDKLNIMVRELEKVAKKVNRLHFIQQLYKGHSVREACSILNIPVTTGYNWLKKWNNEGPGWFKPQKRSGETYIS